MSKFQFKTHYIPGTRLVQIGVKWIQTSGGGPQRSGETDKSTRAVSTRRAECCHRSTNTGRAAEGQLSTILMSAERQELEAVAPRRGLITALWGIGGAGERTEKSHRQEEFPKLHSDIKCGRRGGRR